jgi:hypothetical protein
MEGLVLTHMARAPRNMKEVLYYPRCGTDSAATCSKTGHKEVNLGAYVLLLVAVLSRVIPHAPWWNFTALTGGLLYFGARRSKIEMVIPLAAVIATDYFLTVHVYSYAFHWQAYAVTWAWDVAAMGLGWVLLRTRTTFLRAAIAALIGPTSFFIVVDLAVWAGGNLYPHTFSGLMACYVAALPFYGSDLLSTSLVLAIVLGVPALVRRTQAVKAQQTLMGR